MTQAQISKMGYNDLRKAAAEAGFEGSNPKRTELEQFLAEQGAALRSISDIEVTEEDIVAAEQAAVEAAEIENATEGDAEEAPKRAYRKSSRENVTARRQAAVNAVREFLMNVSEPTGATAIYHAIEEQLEDPRWPDVYNAIRENGKLATKVGRKKYQGVVDGE